MSEELVRQYKQAEEKAKKGLDTPPVVHGDSLLRPGIYQNKEDIVPQQELAPVKTFDPRATLTDLAKEYLIFSTGVLALAGGLSFDPVKQYMQKNNLGQVFGLLLDKPIFNGHQQFAQGQAFNQLLFLVPNEYRGGLLKSLGTLTLVDRQSKTYINVVPQALPLLDIISMATRSTEPETLPMVEVIVFALDGNKACWHYKPPLDPLRDVIQLVKDQPNPNVVQQADMLFSGHTPDISPIKRPPTGS